MKYVHAIHTSWVSIYKNIHIEIIFHVCKNIYAHIEIYNQIFDYCLSIVS
jgi:hypothetical protein